MDTLAPSEPGYAFNTADLAGAKLSDISISRIIAAGAIDTQNGGSPDIAALLAAILRTQRKANCRVSPLPFTLGIWQLQMILTENPLRNWMLIQNVGLGDLLLIEQTGSPTPVDYSAATAQASLTLLQTRAIRIVAGGYYEPLVPPVNPVSIFTLNTATVGTVREGQ